MESTRITNLCSGHAFEIYRHEMIVSFVVIHRIFRVLRGNSYFDELVALTPLTAQETRARMCEGDILKKGGIVRSYTHTHIFTASQPMRQMWWLQERGTK